MGALKTAMELHNSLHNDIEHRTPDPGETRAILDTTTGSSRIQLLYYIPWAGTDVYRRAHVCISPTGQ